MIAASRLPALLCALWLGALLAIAGIAAPALFASLPVAQAATAAARLFTAESHLSLAMALVFALLERRRAGRGQGTQFSDGLMLSLAILFVTVVAQYGLPASGIDSMASRHAVIVALYALKTGLVGALVWRLTLR